MYAQSISQLKVRARDGFVVATATATTTSVVVVVLVPSTTTCRDQRECAIRRTQRHELAERSVPRRVGSPLHRRADPNDDTA